MTPPLERATWCSVLADTTPADPIADVRAAAQYLAAAPDPSARRVGERLAVWLAAGGDLQARLGVRPARGKPSATRTARLRLRDEALRQLAESIDATPTERARVIAEWARQGNPLVRAIHAETTTVPTSPAQVARILRSAG